VHKHGTVAVGEAQFSALVSGRGAVGRNVIAIEVGVEDLRAELGDGSCVRGDAIM
jgi:hypothetical protein